MTSGSHVSTSNGQPSSRPGSLPNWVPRPSLNSCLDSAQVVDPAAVRGADGETADDRAASRCRVAGLRRHARRRVDRGETAGNRCRDIRKLIPGADAMLQELAMAGHRLALVADGPRATFENLLGQHGLWSSFEAHVISGDVGALKPSPLMFAAAFARWAFGRAIGHGRSWSATIWSAIFSAPIASA